MEYFETKTIINFKAYKEIKKYTLPTWRKTILVIFPISLIILSIFCYNLFDKGDSGYTLVLFALGVSLPIIRFMLVKKNEKLLFERNTETGFADFENIVSFTDDKVKVYNVHTNGTSYLLYNVIARFEESKHFYILITKANLFILVNKLTLTQEQKEKDFLSFIKEKCINVRWKDDSEDDSEDDDSEYD